MTRCRPGLAKDYPDLIGPVRELLLAAGVPYVIENVAAARPWLRDPVTLCGVMFGKPVYRHRLFEAGNGITLTAPPAPWRERTSATPFNKECRWNHPVPAARAGHWEPGYYVSVSGHERKEPVREAMAIDWMRDRDDVAEAIPPYMTELIGRQVLAQL
jgi:DNA (cytosine-5)-methyltransferase 1